MNVKIVVLCLFVFCTFVEASVSNTENLYTAAKYADPIVNPSGKIVLIKRFEGDYQIISAFSPFNDREIDVFKIKTSEHNSLYEFGWINDNLAFVRYGLIEQKKNRFYKYKFLKITDEDKLSFNSKESIKINLNGLILSQESTDGSLFVSKVEELGKKLNLYRTDVEDLLDGDVDSGVELGVDLENTSGYWVSKDGSFILSKVSNNSIANYYLRKGTEPWTPGFEINEREDYFKPLMLLSSGNVLALTNKGSDKKRLAVIDVTSDKTTSVVYEHELYDAKNIGFNVNTQSVTYVSNLENGKLVVDYLDKGMSNDVVRFASQNDVSSVYPLFNSDSSSHQIFVVHGKHFSTSYYLRLSNGQEFIKLKELYPGFSEFNFSETLSGIVLDGKVRIEYLLTLPNDFETKPVPLVVKPHGGPIGIRDSNRFDRDVQTLANRGYAVLQVNFRGSSGFGKSFQNSGVGNWGQLIEEDIMLALDDVLKKYPIDKNMICAYGASYGGYSSLILAIKHPEFFKCTISSFGVTDLTLLYNGSNKKQESEDRLNLEAVLGKKSLEELKQLSPVYNAESITVPVLLVAGEKDKIASPEHSNRLKYVLQKLGKPVEFISFEESGHGHFEWDYHRYEILRVVSFLDRELNYLRKLSSEEKRIMGSENEFMRNILKVDNNITDQSQMNRFSR